MGIAQAGIVFKPTSPIGDVREFVSKLCGENAIQIEHPNTKEFDIRNHTDVMVQFFGETCFVCNNDIAWDILEIPQDSAAKVYRALGAPDLFMVFCHYDSGGSYGYAFFENGKRTRSRLQTTGAAGLPPIIEYGEPKDFEQRWLSADFYIEEDDCPIEERERIYFQGDREIEVPEYFLTKRVLDESLVKLFSVCPWDTALEPRYHFFRLTGNKKPWWKLW